MSLIFIELTITTIIQLHNVFFRQSVALFCTNLSCFHLSGVHGSRWDVPGWRDSRNEPNESPEAAAHAAVTGIGTSLDHSHTPPPQQHPLKPAESQSILFVYRCCQQNIYKYNPTFQPLKAVLRKILSVYLKATESWAKWLNAVEKYKA